jgi:hypothetical protein
MAKPPHAVVSPSDLVTELQKEIEWLRAELLRRDTTIDNLMVRLLAIADPASQIRLEAMRRRVEPTPAERGEAGDGPGPKRTGARGRQLSPARVRAQRSDRMSDADIDSAKANLKAAMKGGGEQPAGQAPGEDIESRFERQPGG